MKTAIISFGKPMTLEMPDGFNYSIKRRGTTSVAEYEETFQESRETYAQTAAWFLNWAIERGYRQEQVNSSWSNGTTKLQITESGSRKELLSGIFTEIVAQLKCYLSDREVEDLTRMVTVFDYDDDAEPEASLVSDAAREKTQ